MRRKFNPLSRFGFNYLPGDGWTGEADTAAQLPDAVANSGEVWLVFNASGVWPFRKKSGLYRSTGGAWVWLGVNTLTGLSDVPTLPDTTNDYALVSVAGTYTWMQLVQVQGGSGTGGTDGTGAAAGVEGASQTGSSTATGSGTRAATGMEGTAQTGSSTAAGSGTMSATGAEGAAETGIATTSVQAPGDVLAEGTEVTAQTGTATATGTGTVAATGAEGTAETGSATAGVTASGTVAATGTEGAAETGTATASGGGGGGATITENFDTAISPTAAGSTMAGTGTAQGWTITNSGTDPSTYGAYDNFFGATMSTSAVAGFSGNGLGVTGCHTEDAEANVIGESGYKISRTWAGPFASGTFSIKYKIAAGQSAHTIKVNGVSVGTLTQNGTYQTATIALTNPANITLEVECAPTVNHITGIAIDNITYS